MIIIPNEVYQNVLEIDFLRLFKKGKKVIFCDLDNTLITYRASLPDLELITWCESLKDLGFLVYLFSNNQTKRVKDFSDALGADGYLANAFKPCRYKIQRFIKKHELKQEEIIIIGDQLVTDIALATKIGVYAILVKTIDGSSQKFYTKINRLREKTLIKKIKKHHEDLYRKMIEVEIINE